MVPVVLVRPVVRGRPVVMAVLVVRVGRCSVMGARVVRGVLPRLLRGLRSAVTAVMVVLPVPT